MPLLLRLALTLFLVYCAVFPGSVATVALDAVPVRGEWMGPALLVCQGLAVICWMLGSYGRRGALATLGALLLAWAVEHLGETTGIPFGRYQYTEMLQPQLAGVVPVPITLAWLMAAFGAWQLARGALGNERSLTDPAILALTGTLVVVLDLQIETVATLINPYWVWFDSGPFYGVPPQNFVAWWVVGVLMGLIVALALGSEGRRMRDAGRGMRDGRTPAALADRLSAIVPVIPALLYILSSVMFTFVNLARGYELAGLVGVVFLAVTVVFIARRSIMAVQGLGVRG
jgi:putative membrane protein